MLPPASRERGFALLIVLLIIVLIALIAMRMTASGRTAALLPGNVREAAVAEAAADGAIHESLFHLVAAGQQHWAPSGRYPLTIAGADVQVAIENLSGRVNPNIASPELPRALLQSIGGAQQAFR